MAPAKRKTPSPRQMGKRTKDENKAKLRHSKIEKQKDADAKRQVLDGLQKDLPALLEQAKNDPGKEEKVAARQKNLQEVQEQLKQIEQETKEIEEQENTIEAMEIYDEDGVDAASAAQVPDSTDQAGEDPSRNNISQGGDDNNIVSDGNSADLEMSNSGPGNLSPPPGDTEDVEMPIMTVDYYKAKIGSPTTGCEVVAWKPETRVRPQEVINRYGPKSHPKFRIEAASEAFDETLPQITAPTHRIGQMKAENGRDWAYNYQNVVGILGVAFRVRDDKDPLRALDPAYHTKGQGYTETQVLIQWKNIRGDNPNPRSWEVRGTVQRVCPLRKKGVADDMIFKRAQECEEGFDIWYQGHSKKRDETMPPATYIKVENVSEAEEASSNKPSESINAPEISEKATQPTETSSILANSQAPEPVVGAATGVQATSATPFDQNGWLEDYETVYGKKENMSVQNRAIMMEALRAAKALVK